MAAVQPIHADPSHADELTSSVDQDMRFGGGSSSVHIETAADPSPIHSDAGDSDAGDGDAGPAHVDPHLRRCLLTRQPAPKAELIRLVRAPDGTVTPDLKAVLPGRGAWITPHRQKLEAAIAKGAFRKQLAHGLRVNAAELSIPDGFADLIETLLEAKVTGLLGLERKAGRLFVGYDTVRSALVAGKVDFVIQAEDASADGRRKLMGGTEDIDAIALMTRVELGHAIGRDEVVHIGVAPGGGGRALKAAVLRLAQYRGVEVGSASAPRDKDFETREKNHPLGEPSAKREGRPPTGM
ncbi:MAG: DUF448 domain-containing protein [Pseudomonadota bacterium]